MGLWWLWKVSSCYLTLASLLHFFFPTTKEHSYCSLVNICRLGHREQKDEWVPRRVDIFQKHNVLPPEAVISAGSVNSSCTAGNVSLCYAVASVLKQFQ